MTSTSLSYSNPVIEPPLQNWVVQRTLPDDSSLARVRSAARRRIVDAAQQFVLRLHEIARSSGLATVEAPLLTGDSDSQPIVMTGHQPTVFHPGLVFKYQQTEQVAVLNSAIGLAMVIDTDEGDAGEFPFPSPTHVTSAGMSGLDLTFAVTTEVASLGSGTSLLSACQLKSATQLGDVARLVADAVQSTVGSESSRTFAAVAQQYAQLQTRSMLEANLIVRRQHGIGAGLLEIPLSAFSAFPETLTVAADIVSSSRRFAEMHNQLLAEFRTHEHIRNTANPFPDLDVGPTHCELPFWVVDLSSRRRVAQIRTTGHTSELLADDECVLSWTGTLPWQQLEALTATGLQLVPRGALITALMRLLISDLFVHGTGGAKYDKFTDRLIQAWWNVKPTPFVVASASRFLMPDRIAALEQLQSIASQLRDFAHNPQRYLGTGVFSATLEISLKQLIEEKQTAVEQLQQLRSTGQSGRDVGRLLQQLTTRIREIVEAEFQSQVETLNAISKESLSAVTARTWPWFLFPDQAEASDASIRGRT